MRGRQIERHAIEGDQGHAAGFQLLERGQKISRAAAPAGSVQPHARCGLLEGTNNLITGALGKGGQIPLLTLAGLVGG